MKTMAMRWSMALAAVVLAGCASGVKLDDAAPVETRTPTEVNAAGTAGSAAAGGTSQSKVTSVDLSKSGAAGDTSALPKVIYFDYDSYVVKDEYRPVIDANAKALSADRKKHLMVEGHTDDRGGREYNLALGQKRAEAVVKSLVLLGALDSQLEAVSYGKERLAVQGSDEAAHAKNRRVELIYR